MRLAPESRVFIPEQFGEELRAVRVEGAARFEVAPGIEQPLSIFIRRVVVTARGTAVTVRAFDGDEGVLVRLDEGAATIKAGDETRTLSPGQALFVPDSAAPRDPTAGELAEGVSWTENVVTINNRKISAVLPMLQRWYRMNIRVADQATLDRVISFSAPLDSVSTAIAAIEREGKVKFGYVGENMVFTPLDKPDPKAKPPARKK